jgi:phage shock protein A
MQSSLGQKLRLVVLGNAHELLNKAIDTNSPAALNQYVRDIEDNLAQLRGSAASQEGQLRTMTREASDVQSSVTTAKVTITKILAGSDPKKDAIAAIKASEVVHMQQRLQESNDAIDQQKLAVSKINEAVHQLEEKHDDVMHKVRELSRLDRDSKAKEAAARSIESANQLLGNGIDINDVKDRLNRRNDVASARFDQAMSSGVGGVGGQIDDPEHLDAVNSLLEELKPKAMATAS